MTEIDPIGSLSDEQIADCDDAELRDELHTARWYLAWQLDNLKDIHEIVQSTQEDIRRYEAEVNRRAELKRQLEAKEWYEQYQLNVRLDALKRD